MREITLFHLEPVYVNGSLDNLIKISKKITEDKKILDLIEKDYNADNEKYKTEYLKAKITHLKNIYLCNWLILKKYFEDAIFKEFEITPDYQREDMIRHGWMFPQQCINIRITTSGFVNETTEETYMRYFDMNFDSLFGFSLGESGSRVDRYYKQAIVNYKQRNYYSCVVSLFPIIESYHQFINGFNKDEFYRIKQNLEEVTNKIDKVKQVFVTKINYYKRLVETFNDLAKNHYFKNSLKRKEEPEIINRNRLMHGIFSREVSRKDCLQLFCVISNLVSIKDIISANDRMNIIENELEEINKELNNQ